MWQQDESSSDRLIWTGNAGRGHTLLKAAAAKEISRARYRSDIQDAADQAGITVKVRRELARLEKELKSDERVLALLPATYDDERGLLVATSSRIIFSFDGWVNKTFITYDYHLVTKMRWLGGFISGRMRIYTYGSDSSTKFTSVWNPIGKRFVGIVNSMTNHYSDMSREQYEISLLSSALPRREYQIRENDLIANKIVELDNLFHKNGISREDYIKQKHELLLSMD